MKSNTEIAASYDLWREYVDPSGIDSEEEFEAYSMEERLQIIQDCFEPVAISQPMLDAAFPPSS